MSNGKLTDLQDAAREAVRSESANDKIEALSRAFRLFSEETQRLEAAHTQLKQDFEAVNQELKQTNTRLNEKLKELDTSTSYLRNILSNMSQGLVFINQASIITTYNKSAEDILMRPAIEVLFQPFKQSFDDNVFGFSIQNSLKNKLVPAHSFIRLNPGSSRQRDLEIDARYMEQKDGQVMSSRLDPTLDFSEGLIILVRDVTEVRKLKLLAERNERLKELGEMAAMVAHEIRNPLGGIKGFASLLRRDLSSQPELQQMANYIVEGTDTLNRLVTNVLNYARPVQAVFSPTDLRRLLEEIRDRVNIDEVLSRHTQISIKCAERSCIAAIDTQLIQGALLNLIVNAIEAMPQGGTVTLWLATTDEYAVLKVIDTGTGIPDEYISKIFLPFFTTKPHGNGFGLSEVYKVIQAHAGNIEVTSSEGKGTTFTIKLPLKAPS